jgi:signal transduction histidine kinase
VRDDEVPPTRAYALGMEPLRAIRARARSLGAGRLDALIALAFLLEGVLEALLLYPHAEYAWLGVLATVLIAGGLAVRRRLPIAALALAVAGFLLFQPLGREVNDNVYSPFFAVLFVLFSYGLHEPRGRMLLGGFLLVFCANVVSLTIDAYPSTVIDALFGGLVIAGGPILLGRVIANRSRLNTALVEKAERLRRDRAAELEQAAAEERARIAGELHDVVAHAMSAMVVQAGGARRLAERDPERARAAFAAVEDTGREALTEIRRLLGVLRHQDDEIALAPQPSVRHLAGLVARVRASGLPVDLRIEGDERSLPPGVDLTAYRLVQEALTGALAQGGAGHADVLVRYRPDGIDVEVLDDGGSDGQRTLAGVRERVSLYGGQMHAGVRRSGGHAVRAKLPVGGAA